MFEAAQDSCCGAKRLVTSDLPPTGKVGEQVGLLRHPLAVPQCFTASRADGGGFDHSDAVWIEDKGAQVSASSMVRIQFAMHA